METLDTNGKRIFMEFTHELISKKHKYEYHSFWTEPPNKHKNIWSKTTKYPTESVIQFTGIQKPRNSLKKRVRNSKCPRTNLQRYVYRNTFRRWDCLGVEPVPFESIGKECDSITINKMECSPEKTLEMSLREHFCLPRPQRWMGESWVQGGVVLEGEWNNELNSFRC